MGSKLSRKVRRRMATELLLSEIDFVKDEILNLNKLMITVWAVMLKSRLKEMDATSKYTREENVMFLSHL